MCVRHIQVPAQHYLGSEPIFINNPAGGGAVICHVFNAENNSSAFALFDASEVARGPIALLRLKEPIHLGFHASFDARTKSTMRWPRRATPTNTRRELL